MGSPACVKGHLMVGRCKHPLGHEKGSGGKKSVHHPLGETMPKSVLSWDLEMRGLGCYWDYFHTRGEFALTDVGTVHVRELCLRGPTDLTGHGGRQRGGFGHHGPSVPCSKNNKINQRRSIESLPLCMVNFGHEK